jgi:cytochrome c peroxidase
MWDGRETVFAAIPKKSINLAQSLTKQAIHATVGHAQAAAPPTPEQLSQIISFETGLYTAQLTDSSAGDLTARGATGGALELAKQSFYVGINDSLGEDPQGRAFTPNVFNLYRPWMNLAGSPQRTSIARGEELFNNLPIPITGVGGLNDSLGQNVIMGTCTTCHDAPNIGNHSFSVPLAIGTTAVPAEPALDISGLPVYTVECIATGITVQVTDLGRALITGKCADIGKVKGPVLRGLAARAPYFHNGGAATLDDAVEFYNQRFNLSLTQQQKADLAAFLKTL